MLKGLVFLLIGPSGSGKTSILHRLLRDIPNLRRLITYTTRVPRADEEDGREYFFITRDRFDDLKLQGELIEWQAFYGHLYGSSKRLFEDGINSGIDSVAAYDVLGSLELQRSYPNNVVTIFVIPPSSEAVRIRLLERYQQDTEEGRLRLQRFDMEMGHAGSCKYIVDNLVLDQAVTEVEGIVWAERCARRANSLRANPLYDRS